MHRAMPSQGLHAVPRGVSTAGTAPFGGRSRGARATGARASGARTASLRESDACAPLSVRRVLGGDDGGAERGDGRATLFRSGDLARALPLGSRGANAGGGAGSPGPVDGAAVARLEGSESLDPRGPVGKAVASSEAESRSGSALNGSCCGRASTRTGTTESVLAIRRGFGVAGIEPSVMAITAKNSRTACPPSRSAALAAGGGHGPFAQQKAAQKGHKNERTQAARPR